MTAIIILNWNGADDTLACLDSLRNAAGDFFVVVVDNHSTDDSLARIAAWVEQGSPYAVHLLLLDDNYGFARGNNLGIAHALTLGADDLLLLNNDTEVEPDFLVRLLQFRAENPSFRVLVPQINFGFDRSLVWNCGGRLVFGNRRYYYARKPESTIRENHSIPITFATGCALFFDRGLLDADARIFTERFFFGEEDFDFSLRMKERHVRMACVLSSKIYHKVSASGKHMNAVGRRYLHCLNRCIDIRLHYSPVAYALWTVTNIPLLVRNLRKGGASWSQSLRLTFRVLREARRKDGVTHDDFNRLVLL